MTTLDIAGCGPGGLPAAPLLRRDGHRVRLFEGLGAPRPSPSAARNAPARRSRAHRPRARLWRASTAPTNARSMAPRWSSATGARASWPASCRSGGSGPAMRQAAFFWSLRTDRLERWRERGLDAWKDEIAALWPAIRPLLDRIVSADQLTFARYADRTLAAPIGPAPVHLGDAWHSTSPQLGQGANMALHDAHALATASRGAARRILRGW